MGGFETWNGSDYDVPPVMDQFPDYDWAAGFDFTASDFPNIPVGTIGPPGMVNGPMNPMIPTNQPNMGYTFG